MAKIRKMKSNKFGKTNRKELITKLLKQQGEDSGDSIIGMMSLFAFSPYMVDVAGQSKGLAALKTATETMVYDIKNHDIELAYFEEEMNNIED